MEDPWGGDPWSTTTDDDNHDSHSNALQPASAAAVKLDLPAAPRQAHFAAEGSSRGGSPRRVSPAPWGKALEEEEEDAWGGWNAGAESPGWGRSPGLRPAEGGAVAREASPDPWGGLAAARPERQEEEEVGDGREGRTADSAISLGEEGLRRYDAERDSKARGPGSVDEHAHDIWGVEETTPAKEATESDHIDESDEVLEEATEPNLSERPTSRNGDDIQGAATPEEPPEADRKPSKVQELVEMFDGIAHRSASSTEPPSTPQREPTGNADDQGAALDLPGIRVTEPLDTEALDEEHQYAIFDSPKHKEVLERPESESPAKDDDREPLSETEERATSHGSKPKLAPVPFPIDLSQLDRLFPSTPSTSIDPEPIPDVIIGDTFSGVSERKAWYRVSRFGSLRKYNGGGDDDDGYVRVSWAGSHVRDETLRIVRRWMEEDSIGGRVVLGRRLGAGGANMFNWDSEAPPVEIGELLRAKKQKGVAARAGHGRQASEVVKGSIMSPTEPAFAWSSSLPASPLAARPPEPIHIEEQKSDSGPPPEPKQSLERPASLQLPRPPDSIPKIRQPPSPLTQTHPVVPDTAAEEEEEDDEWGEMVSSPTTTQPVSFGASSSLSAALEVNGSDTPPAPTLDQASVLPPDDTDKSTLLQSTEIHIKAAPTRADKNDPWAADDSDSHGSSSADESQHTLVTTTQGGVSNSDFDLWETTTAAAAAKASPTHIDDAPNPTPKQAPTPAQKSPSLTQPPSISTPPSQPSITSPTPQQHPTGITPSADQDLVANILRNLPDLSYMLH
ncbi:proteinrelated to glucan 1, 4-alpha-glucosidase [Purpureocillium lilacinum]|uniref:Proteinrelated to glucan 1, 4-alpha-glucosidase n=1 Tax=Purpureocillium lilacinum TaxID=33203 RepID=A0A179GHA7_PURLI|nr:proteinrelated to glucan 1, 4-alpha-glucosidase [Purpureocillium lilacinum]